MEVERKKKAVKFLIENNILVDSSILSKLDNPLLLNKLEAVLHPTEKQVREILGLSTEQHEDAYTVKVLQSYGEIFRKKSIQDFISYFNVRYKKISSFLQKKQELQEVTSIKRALSKTEKEQVALIGLLYENARTKNGNIILTIEDPTGQIKAIVHNS